MSQSTGRFPAFPEPEGAEPDVRRWGPLHPEVRVLVGDDVRRRSPLAFEPAHPPEASLRRPLQCRRELAPLQRKLRSLPLATPRPSPSGLSLIPL